MRVPTAAYITLGVALALGASVPSSASAQVPTVESQPRVAVPVRGAVIQTAAPAPAAAPTAQPPGQPTAPTAAPAPAEPAPVTAVTGTPAGVTPIGAAPPATSSSSQAATAAGDRAYGAGKFSLTLDGGLAGWLKAVDGGGISADVVSEGLSAGGAAKKHIAGPKFENISLEVGWEAKPLLDWVAASWKGGPQRKNGSVSNLDMNYKVRSAREFTNAVVTETTFPTLDAGSKDPLYLTVKVAPEVIRLIPGSGTTMPLPQATKLRAWLPGNFRFELAGLDASKVGRIESFTIGRHVTEEVVGEKRVSEKEAGGIEFPNLKITITEAGAQTWVDWSNDFIVKGNNGDENEKNGAIVFFSDPLMKTELGRVNLFNCGIAGLTPTPQVAGAEAIRKMTAELYCERMELVAVLPPQP